MVTHHSIGIQTIQSFFLALMHGITYNSRDLRLCEPTWPVHFVQFIITARKQSFESIDGPITVFILRARVLRNTLLFGSIAMKTAGSEPDSRQVIKKGTPPGCQ